MIGDLSFNFLKYFFVCSFISVAFIYLCKSLSSIFVAFLRKAQSFRYSKYLELLPNRSHDLPKLPSFMGLNIMYLSCIIYLCMRQFNFTCAPLRPPPHVLNKIIQTVLKSKIKLLNINNSAGCLFFSHFKTLLR